VVGVWFYENQDLEKVAGILEKIKIENPGDSAAAPAVVQVRLMHCLRDAFCKLTLWRVLPGFTRSSCKHSAG
jgi:hypothetical protein